MSTGELPPRDRVNIAIMSTLWSRSRYGYLDRFGVETIVDAADRLGIETSARTVRRVLNTWEADGMIEKISNQPIMYRPTFPGIRGGSRRSTDLTKGSSSPSSGDLAHSRDHRTAIRDQIGDIPVSDLKSPTDADVLIYHLFADWGVEAEALSAYGRVYGVGLDPEKTPFRIAIKGDALNPPLDPIADLVVAHPPCQRWSPATRATGDPDEWPNLIPETRDVVEDLGRDWIIENVPDAPLVDPVYLEAGHFGLTGPPYRRAFETSFDVPQPEIDDRSDHVDRDGPFADDDGTLGNWLGNKLLWRSVKHVVGDYPAESLKHSGIPSPYIHYLAYFWLKNSRPDLIESHVDEPDREPVADKYAAKYGGRA